MEYVYGAQGRNEIIAIFDAHHDVKHAAHRAFESGAIDTEELGKLMGRIATGAASEVEVAATLQRKVEEHVGKQARSILFDRGGVAMQLICASLRSNDVVALAEQVATAAAARPYPAQGEASTMGGRCRLQGLRTAPELNGQIGRIIGWNAHGRRRYGVQLDSGQKISCQVRNAVAFDPPQWACPHDFDCTSAELVGKLQARLREVGSERVVLDWTPLVAAVADTVFLLHVAHDMGLIADLWASVAMHHALAHAGASAGNRNGAGSDGGGTSNSADLIAALGSVQTSELDASIRAEAIAAGRALIFIKSTPETAHFFLAHREFFGPKSRRYSGPGDSVVALPWLMMSDTMTMVPQPWAQCCKRDYIVRFCLHLDEHEFTCPICHEQCRVVDHPCQLPCVHCICRECFKKLSPPISALEENVPYEVPRHHAGITCPVCREHFADYAVGESASAPGGISIFEHFRAA